MKNKSSYEPQSLPGMGYEPQGYEPRGIDPEEFEKSQLHYKIYEKQKRNAVD